MDTTVWLPLAWAGLLCLGLMLYVILDGFDLGIGILFPWGQTDEERDLMMNSIAPHWDGNETWLVLAGGGLFAAFPKAYGLLMTALYIPILFMLFALVFRGVAFEFRFKAERSRGVWDTAFNLGSVLAAFFQGAVLGAFIQGIEVTEGRFTGNVMDWLTPFSLMTGFALICGYALLGACWLALKTEGHLQRWAFQAGQILLFVVLAWIAMVSIVTPLTSEEVARRWFSLPNLFWLLPVPILTASVGGLLWRALRRHSPRAPFALTIILFGLGAFGLAVSLWPYTVPRAFTLWETAAPPASQAFLLVGAVLLLPLILAYTAYNYWVFRGKVHPGAGYH
jgi:cytochrome d ubiquinol oxidase subunit II